MLDIRPLEKFVGMGSKVIVTNRDVMTQDVLPQIIRGVTGVTNEMRFAGGDRKS